MSDESYHEALDSTRCSYCRIFKKQIKLRLVTRRQRVEVAGRRFHRLEQLRACDECGHEYHDGRGERRFRAQCLLSLFVDGDRRGALLKELRETMILPAAKLAALLGVRRETLYRWERGKAPLAPPIAFAAAALARDHADDKDTTRSFLEGAQPT